MTTANQLTTWSGCYDDGWQQLIVEEAFAHPAKFARGLIRRIYGHLVDSGYVQPDALVVDPFGGVALGAMDAMCHKLRWIGVELEPTFVALGRQNLKLWADRWQLHGGELLEGDSRQLRRVLAEGYAPMSGRADCVVGSPPFCEQQSGGGIAAALQGKSDYQTCVSKSMGRRNQGYAEQGATPGQLGAMPAGNVDAVVSSPPFQRSDQRGSQESKITLLNACKRDGKGHGDKDPSRYVGNDYGQTPGQLGNESQPTFWAAAAQIVAECHAILKPSGIAVWVTKRFVRNGKIVEFSDQWQALCESCGFRLVERIWASLVKEDRAPSLFGGDDVMTKKRCSFFRRLAEAKGSPRIDWEDVIIMKR